MCPVPKDYHGKKYGKLTGIKFTGKYHITGGGNKKRIWLWACDCGKEKEIMAEKVTVGWTKSCGCLRGKYSGAEAIAYQIYIESYADGDISFEQFKTLSQKPCYYCGRFRPSVRKARHNNVITYSYMSLDRIDNNRGHDLDNVVPCCWKPCNAARSNLPFKDYLDNIIHTYKNLQLHRFGIDGYII